MCVFPVHLSSVDCVLELTTKDDNHLELTRELLR